MAEILFRLKVVTADAKGQLSEVEGKGKQAKAKIEEPMTLKVKIDSAIANLRDVIIVYQGISRVVGKVIAKTKEHVVELKNYARDAEETTNKFLTVYESIQTKAIETAESLASSYGMAHTTAMQLLGDTGDILVGFGFSEEAALDLANQVNELAVDLASFTNYAGGADGASKALTKAMLGETESAKSLGIVLRQGTKEFKEQVNILIETEKMSYNQAMASVLLADAYKQSNKAIGDFARTQHELANQERILGEVIKTVREEVGHWLVPAFLKATIAVNNFLSTELLPIIGSWTAEMELHKTAVDLTSGAYIDLGDTAKDSLIDAEIATLELIYASKAYPTVLQGWYNQMVKLIRPFIIFSDIMWTVGKIAVNTIDEISGGMAGDVWADWAVDLGLVAQALNEDTEGLAEIIARIKELKAAKADLKIEPLDDDNIIEATQNLEAFYAAKAVLDRQSKLTGIALLKDKLAEERKYYEDLGELTEKNEKEKIESYARILVFEQQIAKEREALLKKEEQEKDKAAKKEEQEAAKKLREEKARLKELSDLRTEFDKRQFDLTHSYQESQIEAINRYYKTRHNDLLEAGYDEIEIKKQKDAVLTQLDNKFYEGKIRAGSKLFGDLAKIAQAGGKRSFEVYKMMTMVQAAMDGVSAAIAAWKFGMQFGGPILAGVLTAASIVVTGTRIKEIAGMKFAGGGYTGKASAGTEPDETGEIPVGIVHENELVFQSPLVTKFGGFLTKLRTWMMGESQAPMFALAGGGFGEILPEMPVTGQASGTLADNSILDKLGKIEDAIKDNQINLKIEDNSDLVGFYRYYLKAKSEYERRGL